MHRATPAREYGNPYLNGFNYPFDTLIQLSSANQQAFQALLQHEG